MKNNLRIIEETGKRYNDIIFGDDYIPKDVYKFQINLRNEIINKCLSNKKFKNTLDLGCGTGFHLKSLSKYSENLIGIDMSVGALKESKKNIECEYIVCDINKLPFKDNTIDFIWIAGVLHHVPNDLKPLISNLRNIMRNGSIILIDEPNKLNIFNYINMKLSKADPTGKERPLSLNKVERFLQKNNFTILESDLYEFFSPIGLIFSNNFILNLCILLDKYLHRTFLKKISFRWYILAMYDA